ncbi:hypothetical protein JQC91_16980 [Jannaschia sp. Os4]|uniref:AfsR/SARP family transcriptional regulator n=1 Tax=Jannaschia sp. Os4 TaxID=2807617 RepID=UPI001939E104|nr:BTAD domain-containing putative transcriptional regulator [Jannaschia sp. Os4]MBM2578002.1 hypothetical protein [Jannaschia sp. Os4]
MTLRIHLFGGLRLQRGPRALPLAADTPRALLAMLALNPGQTFARGELSGRLWPDLDGERARAALSTALWRLKRATGGLDLVEAPSRGTVRLGGAARPWIDVPAFERRLDRLRALPAPDLRLARRAAEACARPALLDVEGEWAATEAERLRGLRSEALEAWMRAARAEGRATEALHAAAMLIEAEPFEEAPRALRCALLARRGSRARARMEHRLFSAFLQRELGVAPGFGPDGEPHADPTVPPAPPVGPAAPAYAVR